MNKEHVEDRKLNDSLIRAGADAVQSAREVPLSGPIKFSLPYHRTKDEKSRDQENGSATDLHRQRDPKNIREALRKDWMLISSSVVMIFGKFFEKDRKSCPLTKSK